MTRMRMEPSRMCGCINALPSKSVAHRMLICAALARGHSVIRPLNPSRDILATIHALESLGAEISWCGDYVEIESENLFSKNIECINCDESASALRFLIPITALSGQTVTFTGNGRLPIRPMDIYADCLPKAGVNVGANGGLPLSISGQMRPGVFNIPGNVSSQFVTGLLLALPCLSGESRINLLSPLQSKGYVDITLSVLRKFGIEIIELSNGYVIPGNQQFQPGEYIVEGDWSQAAVFLTAGALGGPVTVSGLSADSYQGDHAITDILCRMGAKLSWENGMLTASSGNLTSTTIDVTDIPDIAPILSVAAAFSEGVTEITGAGRLRLKESDRLSGICDNLSRLGAKVIERADGMSIYGGNIIGGDTLGYNDHRIVMAMAVAALGCRFPVTVSTPYSVEKSYPSFFEEYNRLGGKAYVL